MRHMAMPVLYHPHNTENGGGNWAYPTLALLVFKGRLCDHTETKKREGAFSLPEKGALKILSIA